MSVKRIEDVPVTEVLNAKGVSRQVLIGQDEAPNFAMRVFSIAPGGSMPMHTNDVEHEQYVLRGKARVVIGDEEHEVSEGNVVYIPALVPHTYIPLGEEPFEFICVVPNLPDQTRLVEG